MLVPNEAIVVVMVVFLALVSGVAMVAANPLTSVESHAQAAVSAFARGDYSGCLKNDSKVIAALRGAGPQARGFLISPLSRSVVIYIKTQKLDEAERCFREIVRTTLECAPAVQGQEDGALYGIAMQINQQCGPSAVLQVKRVLLAGVRETKTFSAPSGYPWKRERCRAALLAALAFIVQRLDGVAATAYLEEALALGERIEGEATHSSKLTRVHLSAAPRLFALAGLVNLVGTKDRVKAKEYALALQVAYYRRAKLHGDGILMDHPATKTAKRIIDFVKAARPEYFEAVDEPFVSPDEDPDLARVERVWVKKSKLGKIRMRTVRAKVPLPAGVSASDVRKDTPVFFYWHVDGRLRLAGRGWAFSPNLWRNKKIAEVSCHQLCDRDLKKWSNKPRNPNEGVVRRINRARKDFYAGLKLKGADTAGWRPLEREMARAREAWVGMSVRAMQCLFHQAKTATKTSKGGTIYEFRNDGGKVTVEGGRVVAVER